MGVIKYTNQLEYIADGPLDSKNKPVETPAELEDIPKRERYPGMTVTVLDDGSGKQADYWLVGKDRFSGVWEKKSLDSITIDGDDIEK